MTSHDALLDAARAAAGDARAALGVAELAGEQTKDATASTIIELLAELGEIDLTVARVVEPHLDALLIMAEAGLPGPVGTWGVFAAEAPGAVLNAEETPDGWRLSGIKPWCSLAGLLDRALVTAAAPNSRQLFHVDLRQAGISSEGGPWVARGLTSVLTSDVRFESVPAVPVGRDDWYLTRAGFAWGGIRVAACWFGATRALMAQLATVLDARPQPDPLRLANLGRADVAVWVAQLALEHAGCEIDAGRAVGNAAVLLAARTRAVVADTAEVVMREVGHALGPAPLAFDDVYARRIADLMLYVRQHHAERDLAALAGMLAP